MQIEEDLEVVKERLREWGHGDIANNITVEVCDEADTLHEQVERQYAHVDHGTRDDVICVAEAINDLPDDNRFALLYHEVGHLVADLYEGETMGIGQDDWIKICLDTKRLFGDDDDPKRAATEAKANAAALEFLGVKVGYGSDDIQIIEEYFDFEEEDEEEDVEEDDEVEDDEEEEEEPEEDDDEDDEA
jgi:hypothetical protein